MMQQHPPPQQQPPAKPERANNSSKSDRVSVAVRVRPHNSLEIAERAGTCITITPGRPQIVQQDKAFTYDHVFGESTPQQTIYGSCVHALLEGCFDGYNATVFAYGQTGSGKTYTMGTGLESLASFERLDLAAGGGGEHLDELSGIVPRAAHHLFAEIERRIVRAMQLAQPEPQFEVSCQFVELYNEEIFDLLADSRTSGPGGRSSTAIRIQEDPVRQEIYLHGAVWHQVQSREDIMDALRAGAVNRTTAATNQNQQSSRSHAIFTIQLVQQRLVTNNNNQQAGDEAQEDEDVFEAYNGEEGEMEMVHAKFHFVDLAGSERMKRTGATGDRAKESISINSGLLALGNVISALGGGSGKVSHVPYRDSKLTRLLQDSLGGNSRTLMIACVSPCDWDATETLNTLAYANRAKNIKNKRIAKRYSIGCRGRESVDPIASGLVPPLTDTSTIPYPRKLWTLWYTELAQQCPYNAKSMELEDQLPNLEVPEFRFDGPNDLGQMQRIREFISAHLAKQQGIQESVEHNAELFEAKLKQRLCTADLDHQRVAELQKELLRLKGEGSAQIKEIRQLQRANQALSQRLCVYENAQEQGRRKEEGQRYLDAEREAALKSNRRTFQRIAELFESPVPTTSNVARLRKKFGSSEEELMMDAADDDESMGSSGGGGAAVARKTPKLAPSAEQQPLTVVSPRKRAADGAVTSVRFYDATNRRLGTAGFVNPRYQRRSRSVGSHGPRVLNHQPVSKIPLGTVFQPKLPRGTKHTTQVDAADLKRHDEYMVTRQEVDAHGNVKTKLFKGEVTPTAGGGTNVHFNDVENLYQESPGQFM